MAYEVLARKWRPQQFDDVVGQSHVTRTLKNAIASGRIAHAYLFVGPRGIGKTSISRIFAKALNCRRGGPTPTPCDLCDSCKEIMEGASLDVLEFDAASNTQVDKVRELIIERVHFSPAKSNFKVYIVDEVHMLSNSSFNALLKTLEEPPAHVKFVFATTEPQKVPTTIASRCQRFDLRRIATRDIIGHLAKIAKAEGIEVTEDALLAVARGAEGGLRDAESALDQLISFRGKSIAEDDVLSVFGLVSRRALEDLAGAILDGEIGRILPAIAALDENGKDMQRVVIELLDYFRNLLVVLHTGPQTAALDVSEGQAATLNAHAAKTDAARALRTIEILIETEGRLRYALSKRTLLETALIRCARAATAVSIDTLLKELNALKTAIGAGQLVAVSEPAAAASASPAPVIPAARTPEPTPAAAVAPAIPGTVDPGTVAREWPRILTYVTTAAPQANALLDGASASVGKTGTVDIGVRPDRCPELAALTTPAILKALEGGLRRHLGQTPAVRFAHVDPPPASPAPAGRPAVPPSGRGRVAEAAGPDAPPRAPARNFRKELLNEPQVKKILEIFNGTIAEIHE